MRSGASRVVFEIMMLQHRSRMRHAPAHAGHARIAIGVRKIDVIACKNIVVIRAARGKNQRGDEDQFKTNEQASPESHESRMAKDNVKSKVKSRRNRLRCSP